MATQKDPYAPNYAPTYTGSTANRSIVPGSAYFPGSMLPQFDQPDENDATATQNKPVYAPHQAPFSPWTDPSSVYGKQQSDLAYDRQTQAPDYQMGQYQVGQARRSPAQKGTDLGVILKSLQESSGLPLLGSSSSSGIGSGGTVTGLATGAGGGSLPAQVQMPDTSAARAAAFNRAKDTAGQQSQAAIKALREQMAGRGLLGSGIESAGTGEIIGRTAAGLSDVGREQAIRDAQAAEQRAQTMYGGGITQRGQDIGAMGDQARLAEYARQADAARQAQMMQGLLGAMNIGGLVY